MFDFFIAPFSQELEPPQNPGRFTSGSKWMPWELGFFDGFRSNHVAILPVLDYSFESFMGQEYLGLYPTVEKEKPSWSFQEQVIVKDRYTSTSIKDFQNDYQNWR